MLVCVLFLNGCVRNTTTMKINKDKSMDLEVSILTNNVYKEELSNYFDSDDLEKRGFKINTTTENNYSGYEVTKSFSNIDELSSDILYTVNINELLDSKFDYSKLFKKEHGFLRDTYTAKYKFSISDYKNLIKSDNSSEDTTNKNTNNTNEEVNEVMEFKYTLVLPNKPISNDASSVNGNEFTWNLSSYSDSEINYSFAIYNYFHLIIVGLLIIMLVVGLIILIVYLVRKKGNKKTLIYKEYDPSIESVLKKDETIKLDDKAVKNEHLENQVDTTIKTLNLGENNTNNVEDVSIENQNGPTLGSLEFTLPSEEKVDSIGEVHSEDEYFNNNYVNTTTTNTYTETTTTTVKVEKTENKFVNNNLFMNDNDVNSKETNNVNHDEPVLDIPNAIAFSDIDDKNN